MDFPFQINLGIQRFILFPDPQYIGIIEWEPEEITWEPLTNIMADFKHCGKFKAMVVTDGHLTKEPTEPVYSGVVSSKNLRLAMFLSELNNLQLWGANVGNAYLQALTKEKLYIVSGSEFEEFHFAMYKPTYHTTSGRACWHDKPFDILQQMDFLQPLLFWKKVQVSSMPNKGE